jgi:ERF superfamily
MQRSSQAIGTIAAALAKAQAELVNPEKSLVATIRSDGRRGAERTFRYAPLSSGLDIVRKTLSQHEIATVQTTGIDQAAGIVNLTTLVAHSSGEWIASDWPVCPVADTATPHRMGAALTYARRYALFTLVGGAGEDDLDAPELVPPTPATALSKLKRDKGTDGCRADHCGLAGAPDRACQSELSAALSASLRDELLREIEALNSADEAALWAQRRLGAKSTLLSANAEHVESAFQVQLSKLANREAVGTPKRWRGQRRDKKGRRTAVDKVALTLPISRRIRDRDHVKSVAKQACLVCGRRPTDAHHLRFAQPSALGRKVSDEFTVPLCRGHHREVHRCGNEAGWWTKTGIDAAGAARALWLKSHPLPSGI